MVVDEQMTTVVNRRFQEYDVYIGRGSIWGNPYSHMQGTKAQWTVETRDQAVDSYRKYLWQKIKNGEITVDMLIALDGKRLGCYCAPQRCHGEIIVAAIEWAKQEKANGVE